MEDEETNIAPVLQYLKQINLQLSDLKKDIESLKRDHNRREKFGQHSCDGATGEEQSGKDKGETIQRNHFQRLYSFQGRDDLD